MSKKNRTQEEIAIPKPNRQSAKMPPMPKKSAQNAKSTEDASQENKPSNPPPLKKHESVQPPIKPPLPNFIMSSEMVTGDNPILSEEEIYFHSKDTILLSTRASAILSNLPQSNVEPISSSPSLMPSTVPPLVVQQPPNPPQRQQSQPPQPPTQALDSIFTNPTTPQYLRTAQAIPNNPQSSNNNKQAFLSIDNSRTVFYRGSNVTKIPITTDPIIIGRRDVLAGQYPDVDLGDYWNFDRSISRKHLRVFKDASSGSFFAEDLCSHNATFFNSPDHPMGRERIELHNGDRIYISYSIVFVFNII